ncbi:DUF167 family protein [Rhodoplanes sp. TEM]|uniref:UPF0235 protein PQJ73_08880 n=1 Tax=Rhodoplanes tepidamans TaxID=200616 RepID=A0ABT5J8G6_RHOTP|nr:MULTISPECIES: DUF167 family protein [Rhodoplanes]MDC7785793.1 DUF167 family protein [Rhodoplanes tepidamans]MDC7984060.1 DUF167 family protein [Rhodoplanes sp. TEM]MDQ0354644.1 uncharacterized protein (TIGR00251 family) [Rhodoplanes tepidamans]
MTEPAAASSADSPAESGSPWVAAPDGLVVTVRLTPRGGRDAFDGVERLADGRAVLKARVRAAPTEGEANAALIKLFSRALKVPARAVALTAGDTSRIKRIKIAGPSAVLADALARLSGVSA